MTWRHRSTMTASLLSSLLVGALSPWPARAEFCVGVSPGSAQFLLPKLKLKKRAVSFSPGQRIDRFGQASPATAILVMNAAGTFAAIAIDVPEVSVGIGGAAISSLPPSHYTAVFRPNSGKLNPGDTGSGLAPGISATFTILDCDTVPAIP